MMIEGGQHSCCAECHFEKEKQQVTQRAFERAMNISMFLMEEIEKLSLNSHVDNKIGGVTRQEILNLLKTGKGGEEVSV